MDNFLRLVTAGLIPLATGGFSSSADPSLLMEEMTTTEVRDAIRMGKTTVLIFNGSTEASGQHLALGKHVYRARYLGERIARELGNALVAPVMPFAPTTDETRFPGTINLSPATFSRVNTEVAGSMMKAGFKYIILMGDHAGNQAPLKALAPKLDAKYCSQGVRVFYSSDAYTKSDREIEAYLTEHGFPPSRHAGVADTSELWAVNAKYVRPDKIVVGGPVPSAGSPLALGTAGVEGDPRRSSQELGRIFMEWKVKNAVAEIRKLIQSSMANSGSSK
ncbi:MAG TPA: creatininase family protein [Terriglobales bacterium]|nr:creatininase family protein [Terriglobales bacterium]